MGLLDSVLFLAGNSRGVLAQKQEGAAHYGPGIPARRIGPAAHDINISGGERMRLLTVSRHLQDLPGLKPKTEERR